jgi:hypothetical protein
MSEIKTVTTLKRKRPEVAGIMAQTPKAFWQASLSGKIEAPALAS